MELIEIKTTGTKEAYELGDAIKSILVKVGEAKKDGKIDTAEVIGIISSDIEKMIKGIQGLDQLGPEFKGKPFALVRAVVNPVTEGVEQMVESAVVVTE